MKQKRTKRPEIEVLRPRCVLVIEANDNRFYAHIEANPTAEQFVKMLNAEPLTAHLRSDGNARKVCDLPLALPRCDARISVKPGDLLLDGENKLAICCDAGEETLTRLASIGSGAEELFAELDGERVETRFYLEWSE